MRKKVGVITIILLAVSLVGLLFFNYNDDSRIPIDGIYIINQRSYYAYCSNENKEISLDFLCVNEKKYEKNLCDYLSELRFVDKDGIEYYSLCKPYLVEGGEIIFCSENAEIRHYSLSTTIHCDSDCELEKVRFINPLGQLICRDIGIIDIDIVEEEIEDVSFMLSRINWSSKILPAFNVVEAIVDNYEQEPIKIKAISYGLSGTELKDFKPIDVNAMTETSFSCEANSIYTEGSPVVYYMKPLVELETKEGLERLASANVSKEAYYGEGISVNEYLYRFGKEREDEIILY